MADEPQLEDDLARQIGRDAARKLQGRRHGDHTVWFGFGLFGIVGWSVVVPTLAGAALGLWIDRHWPGERSYTLALLVAGLVVGCATAWRWVARELSVIERRGRVGDDD